MGASVGRSCWMLTARYPRAAKTFARKEYSVNLTVLPWLRIATGSVIMSAFACISLSRRTAMSTATGRLSRAGSLNVSVAWLIAHLLAVTTAVNALSETRMAIPRFMFVLGALTSGAGYQDVCGPFSLRYVRRRDMGKRRHIAYQVRVRAIVPAMICINTPTTHPSIIIIVQKMCV